MTEKPSRNEDEYFVRREAEILRQRHAELVEEQAEAERRTHYMKCPRDGHDLVSRIFHGVTVETCPHCGGTWLDAGELDAVAAHDDHPAMLTRVFTDLMSSLRPPRGSAHD